MIIPEPMYFPVLTNGPTLINRNPVLIEMHELDAPGLVPRFSAISHSNLREVDSLICFPAKSKEILFEYIENNFLKISLSCGDLL
jgi:hypothetical protein